ncbi:nicotinate-nucleotide adenylyltransferase [Lachnoclostridium sp. An169]|uniref:nicotinate-nucleotide adenylyltransferase n=1 Tax=Lachnoclostridium sp. An169 TaxID=1965569 RepID=UPI00111F6B80|nr:nicotinate-nucleotide adenylyltransferase [Lachnoclostridium sp. An169]HJA65911.1 nicotinate-nucleotide adenylyltransferase [Candidatus Mediterraneibacter cottocaccae]
MTRRKSCFPGKDGDNKKIGIMGGTFDPIHIGHLLLGEFAYEDFGLDEIWFLPNGNPPHKDTEDTKQALGHRVEMIRQAIDGVPYFRLNLYEADIKDHSYTYQTMREFNRIYPDYSFYFILGADSLFSIEKWMYFREIFPTCTILAAMRDDKDACEMRRQIGYLKEKYGAEIELLQAPLLEISSTTIRERAARDLSVRYMVPDTVAEYIRVHRLYQKDGGQKDHENLEEEQ